MKTETSQKRVKCPQKASKTLKEALGSLLGRRYNIYSLSPGMLLLLPLSSHSSVLMLNFQNFYITKGPTTSAEKYPASTKSVSQPRPCRGETLAFRQLSKLRAHKKGNFSISHASLEDFKALFSLSLLILFDRVVEESKTKY